MSTVSTSSCPGSGRPQFPPWPVPAFTTLLMPSTPLLFTSTSKRVYFRKYRSSHCIVLGRLRTSMTTLRSLFLLDSNPGQDTANISMPRSPLEALPPTGKRSLHLPPRPTSPWSPCCINGPFSLQSTNLSFSTIFFLIYDILKMLYPRSSTQLCIWASTPLSHQDSSC